MKVLVTGGAGYIGTHTCLELLNKGHEVFAVDNLSNGHIEAIERVQKISNCEMEFSRTDIRDDEGLDRIFTEFKPEAVIHFAGLKAVGESVTEPLKYYNVNVCGTVSLLEAMDRADCLNIVFSSSATVYGSPEYLPYDEKHPTCPTNPYGRTKLIIEEIIHDWVSVDKKRRGISLRYFNPIGAHPSGQIGEDPHGVPNNLMPFISQVASGKREYVQIFGSDYETRDGTGERDYIHVMDLADAHIKALHSQPSLKPFEVLNIGNGKGITVLELINNFRRASGASIKYQLSPRRDGDLPAFWANPSRAFEKLNWKPHLTIDQMCKDTWRWQRNNTNGYVFGNYKGVKVSDLGLKDKSHAKN
jgi:UDP-glucose 4-epimerase